MVFAIKVLAFNVPEIFTESLICMAVLSALDISFTCSVFTPVMLPPVPCVTKVVAVMVPLAFSESLICIAELSAEEISLVTKVFAVSVPVIVGDTASTFAPVPVTLEKPTNSAFQPAATHAGVQIVAGPAE